MSTLVSLLTQNPDLQKENAAEAEKHEESRESTESEGNAKRQTPRLEPSTSSCPASREKLTLKSKNKRLLQSTLTDGQMVTCTTKGQKKNYFFLISWKT